MGENLLVHAALGAPLFQVLGHVLDQLVGLALLLVDFAHLEHNIGRILRVACSVVLDEGVHVVNRLLELAQSDAEGIGVAERGPGLLLTWELGGKLLIPPSRLTIVGELVIAAGDLEKSPLGQRILGMLVNQFLASLDGLADQASVLETDAGIV